jgi:hypothetical protein
MFETGYAGVGYFVPRYVLSLFYPEINNQTIQHALGRWRRSQLTEASDFAKFYDPSTDAKHFKHAGRMPGPRMMIVRNTMWDRFCHDFSRGLFVRERHPILHLYAVAYERFSTAIMGKDSECVEDLLKDMGLAVEDQAGPDQYLLCLDAVFGGRAEPLEDGTIKIDGTSERLRRMLKYVKANTIVEQKTKQLLDKAVEKKKKKRTISKSRSIFTCDGGCVKGTTITGVRYHKTNSNKDLCGK